ncbi:MAG: hypothetical protein ACT4OU_11395 [Hyphomicrobium sp.]
MSTIFAARRARPAGPAVRALIGAAAICLFAPSASAQNSSLDVLAGTWNGGGTLSFEDGTDEKISCIGYYKGGQISVVIRCKGESSNFEFRSKLTASEGDKVSGTWEERTYNVTGEASGTASPGKLSAQFSGSIEGRLDMTFTATSQTVAVTVSTKGTGIKGVRGSFKRSQ